MSNIKRGLKEETKDNKSVSLFLIIAAAIVITLMVTALNINPNKTNEKQQSTIIASRANINPFVRKTNWEEYFWEYFRLRFPSYEKDGWLLYCALGSVIFVYFFVKLWET